VSKNGKSWQRKSLPRRTDETARILRGRYKDFAHYNRRNPFEELLFILCSVQTDEKKYRETFASLRRKFPRFEGLGRASAGAIAKPLKPGGLSPSKSVMIRKICAELKRRFGEVTLAPLRRMADQECEALLTSLPGIGTKVARCVMMYSLGRQVFPVDTHCWRICRRLGWVRGTRDGVCTEADMDRLQGKISPRWRFSLHVNMISLGREVCRSSKPLCELCSLRKVCRRSRPAGLRKDRRAG